MNAALDITLHETGAGWVATVTVGGERTVSTHEVAVSRAEHDRYGGGDVTDLVRRAFAFLLAREPNTTILRRFDLGDIERYFPEFAKEILAGR